jgi:hypothetical protein
MSIVASREVLPRTFQHKFGESPKAQRTYVVTVTQPANTQAILDNIGIRHGSGHPEYSYLICTNANLNEVDRHHVEVTYDYEVPARADRETNPLARLDVWSFSTGGGMVPALFCYAGAGNQVVPLTNSAGDIIEGLVRPEAEMRVTISGNRAEFNYAQAANITNCINGSPYLGGGPYTWLCAGISGQQQVEVVNGAELKYWSFVSELIYRESTHLMFIPNVGWNYLEGASEESNAGDSLPSGKPTPGGTALIPPKLPRTSAGSIKKKRAWVKDPEDENSKVASAMPVALNADGSMKGEGLAPDILVRRVNRIIDFAQFFGVPRF